MSEISKAITDTLNEKLDEMGYDDKTKILFTRKSINEFFFNYLNNNPYFTTKRLTGDFMNKNGFTVYGGAGNTAFVKEIRRVLSYNFRPLINTALEQKFIIKDGRYRYKVIK